MPRKFRLAHAKSPGDITVMTALVRDLVRTYPDIQVDVQTTCKDIWRHNPYVTKLPDGADVRTITLDYSAGIKRQGQETIHFLGEFHHNFFKQTRIQVPLTEPKPDLHLTEDEKTTKLISDRYWVVVAGGKSDATVKIWDHRSWQRTIDMLAEHGIQTVQVGALDNGHWHAQLTGTLNLVGKTNLRDMMRVIQQADGVICGVTAAMHIAAGLERPCVVVAGGREAWWWEAYVRENKGLVCPEKLRMPHRFLHTIGLLACCQHKGCWKNKVTPLNGDKLICHLPVVRPGQAVPKCMDMVTPEHVMEAVMSYYTDKSLPPIKPVSDIVLPAPQEYTDKQRSLRSRQTLSNPFTLFDLPYTDSSDGTPPPPSVPVFKPVTKAELRLMPPSEAAAVLAVRGKLEGQAPRLVTAPQAGGDVFDHPAIGGKFTACVLLYGSAKYHQLHKQCLDSLVSTVPPGRLDLRIASNELCDESVRYVESLVDRKLATKHYRHRTNDKKYPVMREMFWDVDHPITTKWILWFDDDSIADRDRLWAQKLSQVIINGEADNKHMVGDIRIWELKPGQAEFYRSRPWFRGRKFRDKSGKESPNGNKIWFVNGGFWALSTHAMRACNIPDPWLKHNGGDYAIGEQLWQNGFGMSKWNSQKQFIHTSSVPRRGASEKHFGISGTP